MITRRDALHTFALGFTMLVSSDANAQGFLKRLGLRDVVKLNDGTVRDGLREALTVGIERTVHSVGKEDGYLANKKIKINLPSKMQRFERPLRSMGQGPKIDAFVLSMNRAAEAAAPLAKAIFVDAISKMTLNDAQGILKGSDSAATDYLNKTTRPKLIETFSPKVKETMATFSVGEKYDAVIGQAKSLPFARKRLETSVEDYTTNRALDGLFIVLATEEKRIRTTPVARSTDLLKKVFGS